MRFREFSTGKGTKILAGRTADNNEELVDQAKPSEEVFHTRERGSPFVNIKGKPKPGDIKFAALVCARYSHDWRDNKADVEVHRFLGRDIYKRKDMPKGTFGIKKFRTIKVKKQDVENFGK